MVIKYRQVEATDGLLLNMKWKVKFKVLVY